MDLLFNQIDSELNNISNDNESLNQRILTLKEQSEKDKQSLTTQKQLLTDKETQLKSSEAWLGFYEKLSIGLGLTVIIELIIIIAK